MRTSHHWRSPTDYVAQGFPSALYHGFQRPGLWLRCVGAERLLFTGWPCVGPQLRLGPPRRWYRPDLLRALFPEEAQTSELPMIRRSQNLSASVPGPRPRTLLSGLIVMLALQPHLLLACAACAGQSDSPMAKGMNLGILSLLAMIGVVLGGVASFFVYLGKKSVTVAAASAAAPSVEPTDRA